VIRPPLILTFPFFPPIPTFAERVAIIKVSQQADPILAPIIESLQKGNQVSPYVLKQGVLLINKQGFKIMIPTSLIGDVLTIIIRVSVCMSLHSK